MSYSCFLSYCRPIQKDLLKARVFDGCCDNVQVAPTRAIIPQWHSPSLNPTGRPGGWAGRLGCWELPGEAGPSPRAVSWECPEWSSKGGPFLQVAGDLLAVSWVLPQALADTIVEPSPGLCYQPFLGRSWAVRCLHPGKPDVEEVGSHFCGRWPGTLDPDCIPSWLSGAWKENRVSVSAGHGSRHCQ
jgi:hypothetical protein